MMKNYILKLVSWFNKTFKRKNRRLMRANANYIELKKVLDLKLLDIERFLKGDFILTLPSSRTYMDIVKDFKRADERSGFEFSIHERKFMVFGKYLDLSNQGKLILSTFEVEPNMESFPNVKLNKIEGLDVQMDKVGNTFMGDNPLANLPLEYFNALNKYMYP